MAGRVRFDESREQDRNGSRVGGACSQFTRAAVAVGVDVYFSWQSAWAAMW